MFLLRIFSSIPKTCNRKKTKKSVMSDKTKSSSSWWFWLLTSLAARRVLLCCYYKLLHCFTISSPYSVHCKPRVEHVCIMCGKPKQVELYINKKTWNKAIVYYVCGHQICNQWTSLGSSRCIGVLNQVHKMLV